MQETISTAPKLDILIIPGPEPAYVPSAAVNKFLDESYSSVSIAVLTICTGFIPALHSGLLNGRIATAPRSLLPMLRSQHPSIEWTDKRWTRDGKLWMSGGVTNGMDLMAAFVRTQWNSDLVEIVLGLLEVESRGQDYPAT